MTLTLRVIEDAGQDLCFIDISFIMNPEIIHTMACIQVYHDRFETIQFDPLVIIGTEYQRFALFQEQGFFRLAGLVKISILPSLKMLQFW